MKKYLKYDREQQSRITIAVNQAHKAYDLNNLDQLANPFKNDYGVEGFIVQIGKYKVLSFAGSNEIKDWWKVNLNGSWIEFCLTKNLYKGFKEGYEFSLPNIWNLIVDSDPSKTDFRQKLARVKQEDKTRKIEYIFTGHSSGSAIATLAALGLAKHGFKIHLITIAQPELGHLESDDLARLASNTRIYNPFDLLIYLPIRANSHYGDPFQVYWLDIFPHGMHKYKKAVLKKLKNEAP